MGQKLDDEFDGHMTAVRARLEGLLEAQSDQMADGDLLDDIRELAEACGGEILFDLPTDQNSGGMSHWAALRFMHDGEEQIMHVFLSGEAGEYEIASNEAVAAHYSSFTRTWVDVLVKWAAQAGPLPAAARAVQ